MPSTRLDNLLVQRGLVETRSKANDFIKRNKVKVNGVIINKPAAKTPEDANIELTGNEGRYVSRAAHKLKSALDDFPIDLDGAIAVDLGASTGGFCQVLLDYKAAKVYAVDVGHDQLHKSLRENPRITCLEGTDARKLTKEMIPEPVDIITSDLSFISLTKALNPALTFANKGAYLITLIKPQFEVGKEGVGKGGIVRDDALRIASIDNVQDWVNAQPGWQVIDVTPSPITGQSGNQEFLLRAQFDD